MLEENNAPSGFSAVYAVVYLNENIQPNQVSHFDKTTLSGNAPVLMKKGDLSVPLEMRTATAMHKIMRGLVGSVAQMLDVKALHNDPILQQSLRGLNDHEQEYLKIIGQMATLHTILLGQPTTGDFSISDQKIRRSTAPYYRRKEDLEEQLENYYRMHPEANPTQYVVLREASNMGQGDQNLSVGTKTVDDPRLLEAYNALITLETYSLKGIEQPLRNVRNEHNDRNGMAIWFYAAQQAAKGFMNPLKMSPQLTNIYLSVLSQTNGVVEKLALNISNDRQLQHPAIYKHFEHAFVKAQEALAVTATYEEMTACRQKDQTGNIIGMLNLADKNIYDAAYERGLRAEPSLSRANRANAYHANKDAMTPGMIQLAASLGCPFCQAQPDRQPL